jgi:hypothetical protein
MEVLKALTEILVVLAVEADINLPLVAQGLADKEILVVLAVVLLLGMLVVAAVLVAQVLLETLLELAVKAVLV